MFGFVSDVFDFDDVGVVEGFEDLELGFEVLDGLGFGVDSDGDELVVVFA